VAKAAAAQAAQAANRAYMMRMHSIVLYKDTDGEAQHRFKCTVALLHVFNRASQRAQRFSRLCI
jgi:hypothetical protein